MGLTKELMQVLSQAQDFVAFIKDKTLIMILPNKLFNLLDMKLLEL